VQNLTEKEISEISCPLCGKVFSTKIGQPRTKKQWKASLMVHLIASLRHHLKPEEAEFTAKSYIDSL